MARRAIPKGTKVVTVHGTLLNTSLRDIAAGTLPEGCAGPGSWCPLHKREHIRHPREERAVAARHGTGPGMRAALELSIAAANLGRAAHDFPFACSHIPADLVPEVSSLRWADPLTAAAFLIALAPVVQAVRAENTALREATAPPTPSRSERMVRAAALKVRK